MTTVLVVSLVLVLVNGMYVAAEFALIALPRATLQQRAAAGDRFAKRILGILESPVAQDRYIATSQLGITLASLGLGMYGEHTLTTLLEPQVAAIPYLGGPVLAFAIALGSLTAAHIVLGEMVAKGLALQHPEPVGRFTQVPMRVTRFVLYPLVRISSVLARLVLRLVGIRRQVNTHEHAYTPEELRLIVAESEKGGALGGDSGRILRELFEFGDLTASDAMVPRVQIVGIPVGAGPAEIRTLLSQYLHTRYAVYHDDLDNIVGMLHVKDLLRRLLLEGQVVAADARRLPMVPETAALDDVLTTMQRAHAHMAIVIDEHGGTAGLITLEDLFEEVVGEIDEGVPVAPPLAPQTDGSVLAAGTVRLDELGQQLNLDLTHKEVSSLSGLVLAELGRPPEVGDVVRYGRTELTVVATSGRGVKTVRAVVVADESH